MSLPKSGLQVEATGTQAYIGDLSKAAQATDKFTKGLSDAAKSSGSFSEIVTGGLRRVGEVAVNALADAGRAVAGFLKDSVSTAGDVEQTLNVLAVTSGATADEMAKISDKAIALGGDLELPATSAQDAAQAMLELSKAGFTAQESMDAAKGVLQLAAAAEVDAGTAAQIAAGAINAFGLEAKDSARIADLLAGAANASSASMTDLADGLKQGGFAFDAAGQDIDDLVTSLAALTNVGLTGSDAGTALKNAMMRLMNPTDKAAKLMNQLGIEAYDAQGVMKPWPAVLENIRQATAGMTDEQRNAALGTIFLSDGMKALIPLLDLTAGEYDALQAKVTAQGQAQSVAAAQTQGFNGAMAGLTSQIETAQLIIGSKLLPLLTPLIQQFSEWVAGVAKGVDTFLKLAPAISESADPLNTFFNILRISTDDSLNPFINAVQGIATAVNEVVGAFTDAGPMSSEFAESLGGLTTALGGNGEAVQRFVGFIQDNLTPILTGVAGMILAVAVPAFVAWAAAAGTAAAATIAALLPVLVPIAAIGAAAALLGLAWQENWGDIQGKTAAVWAFLQPILVDLQTWLGTNLPPVIEALSAFFNDTLLPALTAIATYVSGTLLPAITNIIALGFNALVTAIADAVMWLDAQLKPAFKAVSDFITSTVMPALQNLQPVMTKVSSIAGSVSGAFDGIKKAIGGAIDAVKRFIDAAAKIKVPSLVTPGSPTPLETGLRGIAAGASEATKSIQEMFATGSGSTAEKFGEAIGGLVSGKKKDKDDGDNARPSTPVNDIITKIIEPWRDPNLPTPQAVRTMMASLGILAKDLPGIVGSAISIERMSSPVAAPQAGSTVNGVTANRSVTYAPVYGQSVQPNPTIDSALAKSMAQW